MMITKTRSNSFLAVPLADFFPRFFLLVVLFALVVSLPLSLLLGSLAYFRSYGTIAPGVLSIGMDLSGMTVDQAAVELHRIWNIEHRIQVSGGNEQWSVAPNELGIQLDALATAELAYQVGRQGGLIPAGQALIDAYENGVEIQPVILFDPVAAYAGLERFIPLVSLPPRNASLRLDGDRFVSDPAELGYTINMNQTMADLAGDPALALLGGHFRLALMPVAPQISDVSAVIAEAEAILNTNLVVRAYDPISNERLEWTVPRSAIAAWLDVSPSASGYPQVEINASHFSPYLETLSASLGSGRYLNIEEHMAPAASDLRQGILPVYTIKHTPTTYTVASGDTLISIAWKIGIPYWKLLEANPGLESNSLRAGQTLIVPSKDEMLPLPVVMNKRVVISIARQRMWLYEDGNLIAEHVISTGIDDSPTLPGVFQIQTHEKLAYASVWDLYMPHFLGIYEAWPGFMNGIHGLPTLSSGHRLWENVLGRPASYGCIILTLDAAEHLFNWAENGVVVEIIE